MIRLNQKQIDDKVKWIQNYIDPSKNHADSVNIDVNANVQHKNVATMAIEIHKDANIQINRQIIKNNLKKLFPGENLDTEYERMIENHEIYIHDETSFFPYCVAIDSTPFIHGGLKSIGGDTTPPQHLASYCGSYVNLLFAIASQFAGAVADVGMLKDFHYFAQKDYGKNYLQMHKSVIDAHLSQIVYTINMPAGTRGYQSIFYNTSVFDRDYFFGLYENSYYPDGSRVIDHWDKINELQKYFLKWFNKEREKSLLTFPVITCALKLNEDGSIASKEWKNVVAQEFSEGNSFFVYMDKNVTSLSSCCRLRNDISDQLNGKHEFSTSLGFGGISTGSKKVITLNMNRFIQQHYANWQQELVNTIDKIHKFLLAHEFWYRELLEKKQLPIYDAGYISMDKQFLTVGLNGVVESAEFLGLDINYNSEYVTYLQTVLGTISNYNKEQSRYWQNWIKENYGKKWKIIFNLEMVPAENLGIKNYRWDKKDNFVVPDEKVRNAYNSYFYRVEDDTDIFDKIRLHGKDVINYLDGGSALHLNLEEHLTKEAWEKLLDFIAQSGVNYFTYNVRSTICNSCGYIDKRTLDHCPKCQSLDIDYATRIIGYLKRISSFSEGRRIEASRRKYY